LRSVKWLKSVPRLKFSQGALYEIGSAMSLFQIKNYADEFRAVLEGKVSNVPVKDDPTVPLVQSDITETTRDFLIKTLAQELKGHPFAAFVGHLLNTMGTEPESRLKAPMAVSTSSLIRMNWGSSHRSLKFR
jgi:restriction system protein